MSDSPSDKALDELSHVAAGKPGSSQNRFRLALFNAFQNFYGAAPDPSLPTREAVIEHCIATVKATDPDFEPLWIVGASLAMSWEVQGAAAVHAALPTEAEALAHELADAEYSLQWLRLSDGGAWMLRVFDRSGITVDLAAADDPQEALLAVAERLLP